MWRPGRLLRAGLDDYVLVLEDDVWFTPGAPAAIDCGWSAALERCVAEEGPKLLYLSYNDAGGTATRDDACNSVFRPCRGLWFLSGYVLFAKERLRSFAQCQLSDPWTFG